MRKWAAVFLILINLCLLCSAMAESNACIGDEIIIGAYEQDNNQQNGKEPITWIVADVDNNNQTMLVVSKYLLDCVQYNNHTNKTKWEKTNLGQWIQSSFIPAAFSEAELEFIVPTEINGSAQQVFILSVEEITKYFSNFLCSPTKYAVARGVFTTSVDGITRSSYWLRLDTSSTWGAFIGGHGGIYTKQNNKVTVKDNGVRPAMYLSMNYDGDTDGAVPSDLKIGQQITIEENTSVRVTGFDVIDALEYYCGGSSSGNTTAYYESGMEAEYVVVKMNLKNKASFNQDYITGSYVELVYDGGFRYGGWIQQLISSSDTAVLSPNDRYSIAPGQTGYFIFGCTVPNMVAYGSGPTHMIIHLLNTDIIYSIR